LIPVAIFYPESISQWQDLLFDYVAVPGELGH